MKFSSGQILAENRPTQWKKRAVFIKNVKSANTVL